MKKYIQRNDKGLPGSVWHTDPRCITIKPDNKVVVAPASMLKAYNITETCQVCLARDKRNSEIDREEDLRPVHDILVISADVIEEEVSREFLRDELTKRGIKFSLRESKNALTRKLCRCWLRERAYNLLDTYAHQAEEHWEERIQKKDRHKPYHYKTMYERSLKLQNLLVKYTA